MMDMDLSELNNLTEAERDQILKVLHRDDALRQKEQDRIRKLKTDVKRLRLKGVIKEGQDADNTCARCRQSFGWIFNKGAICPNCQHRVCDKCRERKDADSWLCVLCFKQMELEAMSNHWFYSKFRKSKRSKKTNQVISGSEIVRTSFKRPPRGSDGTALAGNSLTEEVKRAIYNNNSSPNKSSRTSRVPQDGETSDTQSAEGLPPSRRMETSAFPQEDDKQLLMELIKPRRPGGGGANGPVQERHHVQVKRVTSNRYKDSDSDSDSAPSSPQLSSRNESMFTHTDSLRSSIRSSSAVSSDGRITIVTDMGGVSDIDMASVDIPYQQSMHEINQRTELYVSDPRGYGQNQVSPPEKHSPVGSRSSTGPSLSNDMAAAGPPEGASSVRAKDFPEEDLSASSDSDNEYTRESLTKIKFKRMSTKSKSRSRSQSPDPQYATWKSDQSAPSGDHPGVHDEGDNDLDTGSTVTPVSESPDLGYDGPSEGNKEGEVSVPGDAKNAVDNNKNSKNHGDSLSPQPSSSSSSSSSIFDPIRNKVGALLARYGLSEPGPTTTAAGGGEPLTSNGNLSHSGDKASISNSSGTHAPKGNKQKLPATPSTHSRSHTMPQTNTAAAVTSSTAALSQNTRSPAWAVNNASLTASSTFAPVSSTSVSMAAPVSTSSGNHSPHSSTTLELAALGPKQRFNPFLRDPPVDEHETGSHQHNWHSMKEEDFWSKDDQERRELHEMQHQRGGGSNTFMDMEAQIAQVEGDYTDQEREYALQLLKKDLIAANFTGRSQGRDPPPYNSVVHRDQSGRKSSSDESDAGPKHSNNNNDVTDLSEVDNPFSEEYQSYVSAALAAMKKARYGRLFPPVYDDDDDSLSVISERTEPAESERGDRSSSSEDTIRDDEDDGQDDFQDLDILGEEQMKRTFMAFGKHKNKLPFNFSGDPGKVTVTEVRRVEEDQDRAPRQRSQSKDVKLPYRPYHSSVNLPKGVVDKSADTESLGSQQSEHSETESAQGESPNHTLTGREKVNKRVLHETTESSEEREDTSREKRNEPNRSILIKKDSLDMDETLSALVKRQGYVQVTDLDADDESSSDNDLDALMEMNQQYVSQDEINTINSGSSYRDSGKPLNVKKQSIPTNKENVGTEAGKHKTHPIQAKTEHRVKEFENLLKSNFHKSNSEPRARNNSPPRIAIDSSALEKTPPNSRPRKSEAVDRSPTSSVRNLKNIFDNDPGYMRAHVVSTSTPKVKGQSPQAPTVDIPQLSPSSGTEPQQVSPVLEEPCDTSGTDLHMDASFLEKEATEVINNNDVFAEVSDPYSLPSKRTRSKPHVTDESTQGEKVDSIVPPEIPSRSIDRQTGVAIETDVNRPDASTKRSASSVLADGTNIKIQKIEQFDDEVAPSSPSNPSHRAETIYDEIPDDLVDSVSQSAGTEPEAGDMARTSSYEDLYHGSHTEVPNSDLAENEATIVPVSFDARSKFARDATVPRKKRSLEMGEDLRPESDQNKYETASLYSRTSGGSSVALSDDTPADVTTTTAVAIVHSPNVNTNPSEHAQSLAVVEQSENETAVEVSNEAGSSAIPITVNEDREAANTKLASTARGQRGIDAGRAADSSSVSSADLQDVTDDLQASVANGHLAPPRNQGQNQSNKLSDRLATKAALSMTGSPDSHRSRGSGKAQSNTSMPSIAVTGSPRSQHSRVSGVETEEDDNIDELFASHASMHSHNESNVSTKRGSNLLSPFSTSRESIASFYSDAGEVNYGKIPVSGDMLMGLDYNYKNNVFEVLIKQCRDLAPVDTKRKRSDPYVKTYLLPDKTKSGKRKTRVKKHTLNPTFDETIRYPLTKSELENRTLWVTVWHNDTFGRNDFLGEVTIGMDDYSFSNSTPVWYKLMERHLNPMAKLAYKGDLVVSMKFVTSDNLLSKKQAQAGERGELQVLVKEARNLTAVRANGTSDPFCKGYLLPEKTKHTKQKTTVKKKDCNPRWNHTFVFEDIARADLSERSLELTVWDHDRFTSNDFLGGVRLSLGLGTSAGKEVDWMDSTGEEISLWQSMLDRPNCWIEGTLLLRPSMDSIK